MENNIDRTIQFDAVKTKKELANEILQSVFKALVKKGYNPVDQLVGYLMSGDPTYITNHENARALITKIERDEIMEEILKSYLKITE